MFRLRPHRERLARSAADLDTPSWRCRSTPESGRHFRAAAQTGTETGRRGRGCRGEKPHVHALGMRRGTDRAAIDTRRGDRDEDAAVETRIAVEARLFAGLLVELHAAILPRPALRRSPSRDIRVRIQPDRAAALRIFPEHRPIPESAMKSRLLLGLLLCVAVRSARRRRVCDRVRADLVPRHQSRRSGGRPASAREPPTTSPVGSPAGPCSRTRRCRRSSGCMAPP